MVWSNFPILLGAPSRRVQWDPWREMGRLHDEFTRLFGDAQRPERGAANFPPVRIVTDENGARLTALVPGLASGEVEIVVERDTIKLEGTRKPLTLDEGEALARQERPTGGFTRTFRLPFEIDAGATEARLENGVLEVNLPRTPEQRPRRIEVRQG